MSSVISIDVSLDPFEIFKFPGTQGTLYTASELNQFLRRVFLSSVFAFDVRFHTQFLVALVIANGADALWIIAVCQFV